jgi:hypothetical protein
MGRWRKECLWSSGRRKWARSRTDDPMLLKQDQRLLKKLLLLRSHGMALSRDAYIKTYDSFPPARQINQQIINTGACSLHMDQPTTLKIEMKRPYSGGIS